MKRTPKGIFFVVVLLIAGLVYTSFFGISKFYGDREDVIIRGASDIRFGIDIRGGVDVTFGPKGDATDASDADINAIKATIERRLVENNITDYECYADTTNDRVVVRFPKADDTMNVDEAIKEISQVGKLEFYIGSETKTVTNEDGTQSTVPAGQKVLDGSGVKDASAMWQTNQTTGAQEPIVALELQGDAVKAFSDATAKQYAAGGTISIWFNGEMVSDPKVSAHITNGEAIITVTDYDEAQSMANTINAGSLPFELEEKSKSELSPTLGARALSAMVTAGIIAFCLVALYIVFWYRLPGFVAVIALLGQIAGSIAAISGYFSVFNSFTLTLPGIAGVLLSIGIGVDANVITAERVREELRRGKTIDGAIRAGTKNSFWAIFDGNITVLIVSVVLMGIFGPPSSFWSKLMGWALWLFPTSTTGMVYSFGYTLFVGVILNFVMGVALSRLMLRSVARFKFLRKPWLFGGDRA